MACHATLREVPDALQPPATVPGQAAVTPSIVSDATGGPTTAQRLVRLMERRPAITQTCAARELGVTRARVQQLAKQMGLKMAKAVTVFTWLCPGCGVEVKRGRSRVRRAAHVNLYCRACRPLYCINGHEKAAAGAL